MGQGAHGLPSELAESWAASGRRLNLFLEQEWVHVSGEESGFQASCGSPWVHSSCGAETTQGCARAAVPSVWCAWVSPGKTSELLSSPPHMGPSQGLSPDLLASLPFPPSSMGMILYSLGVEGGFLLVSCVIRRCDPDVLLGEPSSVSSCPRGAPLRTVVTLTVS